MIRITIAGEGHEQVGKDLKHFFETGQRKIVRHYKDGAPEDVPTCDVVIDEKNEERK